MDDEFNGMMKTFKQILIEAKERFYTEIRVFEDGEDFISDTYNDGSKTAEQQFKKVVKFVKKEFKGEGKIKLNVFDTQDPEHGLWIVKSETITV